jgi:cell division protein ZapE
VDVFYDTKVKLVVSAEVPPEEIYTEGVYANEFARTASRLVEMQSKEYLNEPRRGIDGAPAVAAAAGGA